jgi:predicted phage terminase large subunit-like protein
MHDYLAAILRNDFLSFCEKVFQELHSGIPFEYNWHLEAIAHQLERLMRGESRRVIIALPPRSLKSIITSVALPAFLHGHDQGLRIIGASYGQELSGKNHLDYRNVIKSDWYRELFPHVKITKDSDTEIVLNNSGGKLATSIGGTLTGRGAELIIIDDPLKAIDAMSVVKREAVNTWYRTSLLSRLNDKNTGGIVIATQRLHMDDLIGHVTAENVGHWSVLELPAVADTDRQVPTGDNQVYLFRGGEALQPNREPVALLETFKRDIGSEAFSAQYLQAPVPPGGLMFKRNWVMRYDGQLDRLQSDLVIQSWDTASKDRPSNDWSVCTTWLRREGLYYLGSVFRQRLDYPGLLQNAIRLGLLHKPRMIVVEDAGVGTALIPQLRSAGFNVWPMVPKISKEARASVQAVKFEGGRVYLPSQASWLSEYEAELFSFPGGRHDDQVDSTVNALEYEPPRRPVTTTTTNNLGR